MLHTSGIRFSWRVLKVYLETSWLRSSFYSISYLYFYTSTNDRKHWKQPVYVADRMSAVARVQSLATLKFALIL